MLVSKITSRTKEVGKQGKYGEVLSTLADHLAAASKAFITQSEAPSISRDEVGQEIKILLRRHLAWLHALKHAMRQRSAWEHDLPASRRQRRYFEKRIDFSTFETDAAQCLSQEDLES